MLQSSGLRGPFWVGVPLGRGLALVLAADGADGEGEATGGSVVFAAGGAAVVEVLAAAVPAAALAVAEGSAVVEASAPEISGRCTVTSIAIEGSSTVADGSGTEDDARPAACELDAVGCRVNADATTRPTVSTVSPVAAPAIHKRRARCRAFAVGVSKPVTTG